MLYGIARNVEHRELRRLDKAPGVLDQVRDEPVELTAFHDIENRVCLAQVWPIASDALTKMPERRAEAWRLREMERLSYQQIAAIQDVETGTAKSRASRARADVNRAIRRAAAGLTALALLGAIVLVLRHRDSGTSMAGRVRCPDGSAVAVGGDPVEACAHQWRQKDGSSPPPLVAYEDGKGDVTVLPADETLRPELRPLDPHSDPAPDPDVVAALDETLADRLGGLYARCTPTREARAFAEAQLVRLALGNWLVGVEGDKADGTTACAVAHVNVTGRKVVLSSLQAGRPTAGGFHSPLVQFVQRLRTLFVTESSMRCLSSSDAASLVRQEARAAGLVDGVFVVREVDDSRVDCARVFMPARAEIEVVVRG